MFPIHEHLDRIICHPAEIEGFISRALSKYEFRLKCSRAYGIEDDIGNPSSQGNNSCSCVC